MFPALLVILLGGAPDTMAPDSAAGAIDPDEGIEFAQLSIEQRVIIRVPLAPPPVVSRPPVIARRPLAAPAPATEWREKKGPRCVMMKEIRGAGIASASAIDLLTVDGGRYRATLERGCTSTDFYSGFYMEPTRDGALCAGRDAIQARSGADCMVRGFSRMVAAK